MRRLAGAAAAVGLALVFPTAGAADDQIRTPSDPVYRISLRTDEGAASWRGTESVSFANSGREPLRRVWLRLWPNGINGCAKQLPIRVSKVTGGRAGKLQVECTALPVDLPAPLAPGRRTSIGSRPRRKRPRSPAARS